MNKVKRYKIVKKDNPVYLGKLDDGTDIYEFNDLIPVEYERGQELKTA